MGGNQNNSGANPAWQLKGCRPVRYHDKRRGGYHNNYLRVCDRSGFVYDVEDTRKEWTNLILGSDDRANHWEIRHPQEFVRGLNEHISVPEPRPGNLSEVGMGLGIANITAISGSVAGGVYTSGAATETRPFIYWKLALGSAVFVNSITLTGFAASGTLVHEIRRGFFIETSSDDVTYTPLLTPINDSGGGVTSGAVEYSVPVSKTANFLRLTLRGGKGFGYTGAVTMTGVAVERGT